ncbi:hypothetical protein [Paraburkholderia tropica]|uniref:Uncharacterized protein n=1 Tax=Paraburkholderia tropica TaxID=92647 RepID=A0AAQ1JW06_9BURK|nr:hypothetical protein [Paraburkholderia tropica]SEK02613.1 hypothetical protein SAMN05216550_113192 [Paraburkholderia tropica]
MKKLFAALLALVSASVFAQSYPSPTYNNLTVQGTATLTNHPLAVSSGGTNAASASGTALDNITGFSSTGFLTRTGTGTYAFQSLTNGITYANLAQAAANTVLGNSTGAAANVSALTVPSCSTASSALIWTSANGFGCNTAINASSLGGTAAASYALLASPTFTGTPAAPTASVGTNTTQIATTAFVIANAGTGRLIGVQVLTTSGTYTPDTGTNSVITEQCGGGGAGGGAAATSTGQLSGGAGGSAGGYIKSRLTSGFSGVTVTIGAGGVAASGAAGGAGGNTVFGTLTANGGSGGVSQGPGTTFNANNNSNAGTASGGTIINLNGQLGTAAFGNTAIIGGIGGDSPLGAGGYPGFSGTAGTAGTGYCAGGGGTANGASQAANIGGAGAKGVVIVWEYN